MTTRAQNRSSSDQLPASTPSILIVEDDPVLLKTVQEYLGGEGYSVVCSSSAAEAIALLKNRTFSVVLVDWDLSMGGSGGSGPSTGGAVLKACRDLDPWLPVIVWSGYDTMDVRTDAVLAEADSFLAKPFSLVLLANHLRHWLNRARASQTPWKLTRAQDILPLEEVKRRYVVEAVRLMDGNVAAAARKLDLHRHTVAALLEMDPLD